MCLTVRRLRCYRKEAERTQKHSDAVCALLKHNTVKFEQTRNPDTFQDWSAFCVYNANYRLYRVHMANM